MSSTTPSESESRTFSCPLCCEDKPIETMCELTNCCHEQCKECLAKWTQKAEAAGYKPMPECPFCRVEMTQEDTIAILGRPFQPAKAKRAPEEEAEMDELTQQWIQAHTQACPRCGSHIEKISGCDKMECLCGYRFCYSCGSQGAQCGCSPGHNFLTEEPEAPLFEPVDNDEIGRVDLSDYLIRRMEQRMIEDKRKERAIRPIRLSMEQESLDSFTASAMWLFTPNGIKRLGQHLQTERVQEVRFFARCAREEEVEKRDEEDVSSYGAWLFCNEKAELRESEQRGVLKQNREEQDLEAWIARYGALSSDDDTSTCSSSNDSTCVFSVVHFSDDDFSVGTIHDDEVDDDFLCRDHPRG